MSFHFDFVPKCKSDFHRAQEIQLRSFYPNPKNASEVLLHKMCPIRALNAYVDRTKDMRRSNQLFISCKKNLQGNPVSKRTISSWLVQCIKMCYQQQHIPPPSNVKAHNTRAMASSWAAFAGVDPTRICKAAVWSHLHTFCKHYRLQDLHADSGIFFGSLVIRFITCSTRILVSSYDSHYECVQEFLLQ